MSSLPSEMPWPAIRRSARTVLVVDVVEFVRLMDLDEEGTVRRIQGLVHQAASEVIPVHDGRLVKSTGDGMVIEFSSTRAAVKCAHALMLLLPKLNEGLAADAVMTVRMGLTCGDIYVDEHDIQGRAVNLAARLASLAGPGEIVASSEVRDQLVEGVDALLQDLGDCWVKHLRAPVRAFRVDLLDGAPGPKIPADTTPLNPSLAIIPWAVRGDDDRLHTIAEMAVDEVINIISRTPGVRVISRLSTSRFVDRPDLLAEAHRWLGVDYLCTGVCRLERGQVRAHIELTDARFGDVLLADTLLLPAEAVLGPQAELAAELASRLCMALLAHQLGQVRTKPLPNLSSYSLLHGGIQLLHRLSPSDFDGSRRMLEALVQRVPRHATPLAWLARWHDLRIFQGWSSDPKAEARMAHELSQRALDLDASSSIALTTAGAIRIGQMDDLDGGIALYQRALAINPNEPLAWLLLGAAFSFRGDGAAAVNASEKALALSPVDPLKYFFDALAASAALADERFERAIELASSSLKANSAHLSTWRVLAIAQSLSGRDVDARATVTELLRRDPGLTADRFLARSPGGRYPIGRRFADALVSAGVPRC
jgi:adenylate cyclase